MAINDTLREMRSLFDTPIDLNVESERLTRLTEIDRLATIDPECMEGSEFVHGF